MLPNLIIPGAQKSGTSSLYFYLKQHPECIMAESKEPIFFSKQSNLNKLEEYKKYFRSEKTKKFRFKIIGDASTSYMVEEYVPERIMNTLGSDIKFIFLLRNPVERTISAYWHLYKRFHEKRDIRDVLAFDSKVIDKVIEQENNRIKEALKNDEINVKTYKERYDDYLWIFRYVRNSLYSKHISRFIEYFNRANMLFIFTKDLRKQPQRVLQKIERFLGIDDIFIPNNIGKVYNRTFIPKQGDVYKLLYYMRYWRVFKKIKAKLSFLNIVGFQNIIDFLDNIHKKLIMDEKPKVDNDIKRDLEMIFIKEKEKLAEIIDVNEIIF